MNWQPDEAGLAQIIQLLKESQISKTEVQKAVQQVSLLCFAVAYFLTIVPLVLTEIRVP